MIQMAALLLIISYDPLCQERTKTTQFQTLWVNGNAHLMKKAWSMTICMRYDLKCISGQNVKRKNLCQHTQCLSSPELSSPPALF